MRQGAPAAGSMFLEREAELGRLGQLLGDLDSSGGRVVLVRGEAGVGKTLLVSRFLSEVEGQAHVLLGVCDDLLTPQPLGPVWDMARQDSSLSAPLSRDDRRAVMETLLELLCRRLRPTVVVFEDVQWADKATLDVTKFLGRRMARAHGLLVLTYRDGEVDPDHPLRLVMGELPPQNLVRMSLAPLSAEGVAAMVGGTDLDVDEVMALTGGNPLFVTEVLAWGVEQVPASVRDSVLARAAKLSAGSRRVLDLVSVIPGGAERALIEGVLDRSPGGLAECERRDLVRIDAETVSFRHELARRAVESALSSADRRRLNQQVLAVRIGASADPAVVVHHAREAEDVEAIVEFAPKAARAAMAVEAHREALGHFRVLEPYLDRFAPADRAALLEDRARTELYLVDSDTEALESITRAIELYRSAGSDRALAEALSFAVRLLAFHQPQAAEACAAEAIAILEAHPPSPELAYAVSQQAWLAWLRGAGAQAIELAHRAIGLAGTVGDQLAASHALNTKGLAMCGDPAGLALLEEAHRRAEQHGYPFEEVRALSNMADSAAELLELEWATDLARRARDAAARHEMPTMEAHAQLQLASYQVMSGDWAAAEDALIELLAAAELPASWMLGALQARRGRPEARSTLERAWSLAQTYIDAEQRVHAAAALAEHLWLTGEDDPDLIDRFREVLEAVPENMPPLAGVLPFWLWELGHLSAVPDWITDPYRLLMTGRPIEAAAIWEGAGCPCEQALALMHGDVGQQLHALRILEGLGASGTAARVRRLLADQGVRVPRGKATRTREHAAGLTARQAEVLGLLAEGLTSPQIADRLFISPRTAESHVAAILTKLGAPDRQAAVDAARHRGLLTASPPAEQKSVPEA